MTRNDLFSQAANSRSHQLRTGPGRGVGWPATQNHQLNLVGSFNPSEKYEPIGWLLIIPNIWENKTCSKPPGIISQKIQHIQHLQRIWNMNYLKTPDNIDSNPDPRDKHQPIFSKSRITSLDGKRWLSTSRFTEKGLQSSTGAAAQHHAVGIIWNSIALGLREAWTSWCGNLSSDGNTKYNDIQLHTLTIKSQS